MQKWIFFLVCLACWSCKKESTTNLQVQVMESGTQMDLKDVVFVSAQEGYAVGGITYDASVILRTLDGGHTWKEMNIINNQHKIIYKLYPSQNKLQAVGLDGKMYVHYFGTNDWHIYQNIWWERMKDVHYYNEQQGLAVVGRNWNDGSIYHIDSTGYVLQRDTFNVEFNDILYTNNGSTLVSGYGLILYSTDDGQTWTSSDAKGDHFVKMEQVGNNILALGYQGSVMVSENEGKNWKKLRNGNAAYANKIHCNDWLFINELQGFVIGNNGNMMVTKDGGKNWELYKTKTTSHLYSIKSIDETTAIIVGASGVILKLNLDKF